MSRALYIECNQSCMKVSISIHIGRVPPGERHRLFYHLRGHFFRFPSERRRQRFHGRLRLQQGHVTLNLLVMPVRHFACCNEVDASVSFINAQVGNVPLPSCRIGLQILCPKADKPPTGSERVSRQSRQRPDAPPRRISVTHCSLIICPHGNVLWPKTGACKCNQSPQGTLHNFV